MANASLAGGEAKELLCQWGERARGEVSGHCESSSVGGGGEVGLPCGWRWRVGGGIVVDVGGEKVSQGGNCAVAKETCFGLEVAESEL